MPHIFTRYDKEIEELHQLVQDMGELACKQLSDAADALRKKDTNQAWKVTQRDAELNDMDVRANEKLIQIIALRQPVAKDLRDLMAVDKIILELERAGDEARKIARLTYVLYGDNDDSVPELELVEDILELADFARTMLTRSLKAIKNFDCCTALEVIQMDEAMDCEMKTIYHGFS